MACEHKHLRCTNGIFYCLDCGAKTEPPAPPKAPEAPAAAAEPPKRKTRKRSDSK